MNPAKTLRAARLRSGLTQSELAGLAATSQSAIATYESGVREPSWPVLERIVRAAGEVLEITARPDERLFRLSDLAQQIQVTEQDSRRLRLVFEFLRAADQDGHPLPLLVAPVPALTGDRRFDALLAAIAEDLCVHSELVPPTWVLDEIRFLDGFWWVTDLPSARARALVNSPASYRRRGVMLDRADLVAA